MANLKSKIEQYQNVLEKYIRGLANEYNNSLGSDRNYHAIIDLKNNHFQFIHMGWSKDKFIFLVLIHLTIHPETGNIWIQQNNTEIELDIELEQFANVPKEHLVLDFRPEYIRDLSEYAVA
jgi:hypothetical protein